MNILVDDQTGKKLDEDHRVLQQGCLVVLTRHRPPTTGHALEWLLRCFKFLASILGFLESLKKWSSDVHVASGADRVSITAWTP